MLFVTLDSIIRRALLAKSLPLHYYVEYMVHASACVRELVFDSLQVVNTVVLELNSYSAADLPCDYVDFVGIGIPVGQFLQPQFIRSNITPLRNQSSTNGAYIPYGTPSNSDTFDFFGFWPGWYWYTNINDLGENQGQYYGINSGASSNGFQIFPERGQIQFTETFTSPCAVLIYISDGQTLDNASQITPMAISTIDAYSNWKHSPNADIDQSPEGRAYGNQRRLLRARKNDLTPADIRNILYNNYRATVKE